MGKSFNFKLLAGIVIGTIAFTCLTACGNNKSNYAKQLEKKKIEDKKYNYFKGVEYDTDNEEIVYDDGSYKLKIFNKINNKYRDVCDNVWTLDYGFKNNYEYYVISHQLCNKCSLVKIEDGKVITLENLEKKDFFYPLFIDDGEMYFIQYIDDLNAEDFERKIIKYNKNKKFEDIVSIGSRCVTDCVKLDNKLYYVEYNDDNTYTIYCFDFETKKESLYKDNLQTHSCELFVFEDNIYYYEQDKKQYISITSDNTIDVNSAIDTHIDSDYNLAVSYFNEKADTQAIFTDLKTGKIIAKSDDYVGYKISDGILYIYGDNGIVTEKLN